MTFRARGLVHLNAGTPGEWWSAVRWSCAACSTHGTIGISGPWPRELWELAARSASEHADLLRWCPVCTRPGRFQWAMPAVERARVARSGDSGV